MNAYLHYLKQKNSDMKRHHMSPESFQSNDNASLLTLPARTGPPVSEYIQLEEDLRQLPMYKPVCVYPHVPDDKYARRHWLAKLSLPFSIQVYHYA